MYCGTLPELSQIEIQKINTYLKDNLNEKNRIILFSDLFSLVNDSSYSYIGDKIQHHKLSQYFTQNNKYQTIQITDEIKIVTDKQTAYVVQGSISYHMKIQIIKMSYKEHRI
jgi:hypothetical protein